MDCPEDIGLPPSPPPNELSEPTAVLGQGVNIPLSPIFESSSMTEDGLLAPPAIPSRNLAASLPARPRNRSPATKGHLRSHTSTGSLTLPAMQRAHSSPGVDSSGRVVAPLITAPYGSSSPLSYQSRRRSTLRLSVEDSYPGSTIWNGSSLEPNVPENAELNISRTNQVADTDLSQSSPTASSHNTFPRARRRPTSPLHQSASAPSLHVKTPNPTQGSATSSPLSIAQKYAYEPYPSYSFSSASSMPSTPTSLRSRSPSISSLETIPDTPDAEEAARIEAEEELATLRVAYDSETKEGGDTRRKSVLGSGFGNKKDRKRWSVSGAERRADFSLEPIEE